jgi:hypothetical protein
MRMIASDSGTDKLPDVQGQANVTKKGRIEFWISPLAQAVLMVDVIVASELWLIHQSRNLWSPCGAERLELRTRP